MGNEQGKGKEPRKHVDANWLTGASSRFKGPGPIIKIVIDGNEPLHVHKAVLQGEYFKTCLRDDSPWREKDTNTILFNVGEQDEIHAIDPAIMRIYIELCYKRFAENGVTPTILHHANFWDPASMEGDLKRIFAIWVLADRFLDKDMAASMRQVLVNVIRDFKFYTQERFSWSILHAHQWSNNTQQISGAMADTLGVLQRTWAVMQQFTRGPGFDGWDINILCENVLDIMEKIGSRGAQFCGKGWWDGATKNMDKPLRTRIEARMTEADKRRISAQTTTPCERGKDCIFCRAAP